MVITQHLERGPGRVFPGHPTLEDEIALLPASIQSIFIRAGEKRPFNINKAIESTITTTRNEWKYVAEIITDLDPKLPRVPCLPGQFNQAILNIIIARRNHEEANTLC